MSEEMSEVCNPESPGPADVECDFCTEDKHKAIRSCLMCQASFCETHLKPHYEHPGLRKHTLVEACGDLQEKICSQHDEVFKFYCRTDRSFICCVCTMEEHKGHDTVPVQTVRSEKQNEVKKLQMKSQQRIQEKQKKLQELQQTVTIIKAAADAAVQNNEKIFTELFSFMEKKRSEMMKLIRDEEKTEVSRAEGLIQQLEQEMMELLRRGSELEELSQSQDHVRFLQSFESLCVSPGCEDSSMITMDQHLSFDGVNKSLSDLKKQIKKLWEEEFSALAEPKSREDHLQYLCNLSLDPNTANGKVLLSEKKKTMSVADKDQRYPDHPERFSALLQVLSQEKVSGRCYWEVEWTGGEVFISVSYKDISRKGRDSECWFGYNEQSWSLECSASSLCFWHNNVGTELEGPAGSRIGVYVDHGAGILTFYSVSDKMKLLHRVRTTFIQPLYAGFRVTAGSSVRLCDAK